MHHANALTQRRQGDVAHIGSVDRHRTRSGVDQARQQQRDSRFSRAARSDNANGLARSHMQREPVEHGFVAHERKLHVLEMHSARTERQADGAWLLGD